MELLEDVRRNGIDGDLNATQDQVHTALAEKSPRKNPDGLVDLGYERGWPVV